MIKFLKIRPSTSPRCPLFLIPGKRPLSKTWFNHHLKQILIKSNLSPEQYTAHSFRIGAATSAANQGISSSSLYNKLGDGLLRLSPPTSALI